MKLFRAGFVLCTPSAGAAGVIREGGLIVNDGIIVAAGHGPALQLQAPHAEVVDFHSAVICPGLVNAHAHGRGLDVTVLGVEDAPLEVWLPRLHTLPAVSRYWNTHLAALLQVRSGITTTVHMHAQTSAITEYPGEIQVLAGAYHTAGLRAFLALDWHDLGHKHVLGPEAPFLHSLEPPLRAVATALFRESPPPPDRLEFRKLWDTLAGHDDGGIVLTLGPPGPYWCSDEVLADAAALTRARGLPCFLHVGETAIEARFGPHVYGEPTLVHLARIGALGPQVVCAHGIWLEDAEVAALADARASVVHNPSSNLRLGSGIANVRRLLAAGVNVALGTDSLTLDRDEDLWREMRLALALSRLASPQAPLSPVEVLTMATEGGARALGLAHRRGTLQRGKDADFCVIHLSDRDLDPSTLAAHLTQTATHRDVVGVYVAGRGVMVDAVEHTEAIDRARREALASIVHDPARQARCTHTLQLLERHLLAYYRSWTERRDRHPAQAPPVRREDRDADPSR